MKKILLIILTAFIIIGLIVTVMLNFKSNKKTPINQENFVLVKGGRFINTKSNYYKKGLTIKDFYIGRYEVTQKEWKDLTGENPSKLPNANAPVEMVSWYDCIEFCNKLSEKEGLSPVYKIDKTKEDENNKNEFDKYKWTVTLNIEADGYRLPSEAEWEYAAGGGQLSKSYQFSGGDKVNDVAWSWQNSGDRVLDGAWNATAVENNRNKSSMVGQKKPNELGLYDMSGNVREWCWDWYAPLGVNASYLSGSYFGPDSGKLKVWKGGGWMGDTKTCEPITREGFDPSNKSKDHGFRLCRKK